MNEHLVILIGYLYCLVGLIVALPIMSKDEYVDNDPDGYARLAALIFLSYVWPIVLLINACKAYRSRSSRSS